MEIVTQLITPFYMGDVDYDVLEFLVDRQARYKTDGVLVCGKWGEKSTLSDSEHIEVAKRAVKASRSRIKVYASAGSNDTAKSIKTTEKLLEADVDGISLTLPYYNKGKDREIVKATKKIKAIAKEKRVFLFCEERALNKESEDQIKECGVEIVRDDGAWRKCHYLDDRFILNALCVNGVLFSVFANVFPSSIIHIKKKWEEGEINRAVLAYFEIKEKIEMLISGDVPFLKYALSLWGLSSPFVRSPLIECDEDEKTQIRRFFD
ncbi:MAG: dihydrodipicolinate synthase family protein [Clostridiales bacterium]|nr:dihydrodipicolinate synthase family protein [Clostridiales bacterium]